MSELNIGKVIIDQTKTSQVTVNYADTSKPDTSTITSNRSQMTATVESIATAFEASKTYYFDENGNPVTTNQGYGALGTTDSNGVLTVAHSIPSITALTTDPESPEPATNFELSGESTCLVGEELTLQYSTDDSTWLPLGVATVQPDGTWSKVDCQIADAGSYYLRAVYDVDVVESASISVTVASASERYQILSENCDFITIDSCPVGTTKIAIAGHIYNMTGVVKLGGETIAWGNALNLAVLILYDISTQTIDFIKTSSNTTNSETAGSYVKILDADDTYIYWLREQSGYYLTKITISDGTVAESSVFGGTVVPYASGMASMCSDANYCYVMCPYYSDKRRVMGIRIAKSDLALGTATDLSFSPAEWTEGNNNSVCTDGTYLYWVQNAARLDTQVVRSSMTIASQSIIATYHSYDPANPSFRTFPYNAVYANSRLYVSMYDIPTEQSWIPDQRWTYDGTNKASVGGRLSLANGIILSSISGTLQKLSSSLSISWNKDYAGDAVSGEGTVVYVGEKYYYVGYSSGDFDGNNPTNTKRCAIIGKIDIANGDL